MIHVLTGFVPFQVNELAALQDSALYSWAQLQPKDFGIRILGLWTSLFVFLGGPIAAASFEPSKVLKLHKYVSQEYIYCLNFHSF